MTPFINHEEFFTSNDKKKFEPSWRTFPQEAVDSIRKDGRTYEIDLFESSLTATFDHNRKHTKE